MNEKGLHEVTCELIAEAKKTNELLGRLIALKTWHQFEPGHRKDPGVFQDQLGNLIKVRRPEPNFLEIRVGDNYPIALSVAMAKGMADWIKGYDS